MAAASKLLVCLYHHVLAELLYLWSESLVYLGPDTALRHHLCAGQKSACMPFRLLLHVVAS